MKKFLFTVVLLLAALIAAILVFQDAILKTAVEQAVSRLTGFPTTVHSIHYTFPETINVRGLKIKNPDGFEKQVFADIPEIYISLSLGEILHKEKMHLREVRLNIQEVNIERNKQGVTNLQKLSSVGQQASGGQSKPAPKPAKGEKMPFLLDRFVLTLRRVSFDNRGGVVPGIPVGGSASADLRVDNQVFTNINDPLILVNLVVMKIVYGTTFGRLAGLDPTKLLGEGLQGTFQNGEQLFKNTAGMVTGQVGSLANQATGELGNLTAPAGSLAGKATGYAGTATDKLAGGLNEGISGVSGIFGKLKSTASQGLSGSSGTQTSSDQTSQQ